MTSIKLFHGGRIRWQRSSEPLYYGATHFKKLQVQGEYRIPWMGNDSEERTRKTVLNYTIRQHAKRFLNRNHPPPKKMHLRVTSVRVTVIVWIVHMKTKSACSRCTLGCLMHTFMVIVLWILHFHMPVPGLLEAFKGFGFLKNFFRFVRVKTVKGVN